MSIIEEAGRCLNCKKPRCSQFCPIETPVPQAISLFKEGKIMEAGQLLFENNPLSAITSIVCPHENNCFGHCVVGVKGLPVEFYEIEKYVSGFYLDSVKLTPPPSNGMRVAVVGAGPAGITMSIILAMKGYSVTLVEARDKIGGVLRYGIPEFRLPKNIVDKYDRILKELGVKFKPNTFIGATTSIDDMLSDGYKAVFIAIGTAKPNKLGLIGETLGHVSYAVDYLRSPDSYVLGDEVVVVGAGNVAIDAARMAVRKSPQSKVTMINIGEEKHLSGTKAEIEMAHVDGINMLHNLSTVRISDNSVVCVKTTVIEGENGRRRYEEDYTQTVEIPASSVILAIGQGPQGAVLSDSAVDRTKRGLVDADENGKTSREGIFAAGDVVSGPKTVVQAVAFAKKVSEEIDNYCRQ